MGRHRLILNIFANTQIILSDGAHRVFLESASHKFRVTKDTATAVTVIIVTQPILTHAPSKLTVSGVAASPFKWAQRNLQTSALSRKTL